MEDRQISMRGVLTGGIEDTRESPLLCLTRGAQNAMIVFSALALHIARIGTVPPGLTTRAVRDLSSPTLGGLHAFLIHCETIGLFRDHADLAALMESERRNKGPLARLVQLRNQLEHPRDLTREQVLEGAAALLEALPHWFDEPRIEINAAGHPVWLGAGRTHDLWPLIALDAEGELKVLELQPNGHLRLGEDEDPHAAMAWRSGWADLRARDRALADPDWQEFRGRAAATSETAVGESPWWLDQIWSGNASGLLVAPNQEGREAWSLGPTGDDYAHVIVVPEADESFPAVLPRVLGLADMPSLAALVPEHARLVVQIAASHLDPRELLQHLYWLADFHELGCHKRIRLILVLGDDQLDALWMQHRDRLPDRFDEMLLQPRRSREPYPARYRWPATKPRRFLGLWP